ncbi:MAG: hypothetical protein JRG76_00785 [Deltaproteobacteria bacterium]|nr:hypothetical protein [Deltaproteobacteria bacterium]
MRRLFISLIACGPLACGFAHVNQDAAQRPDRAMGTGATLMMPGDSPPRLSEYDPYRIDGSEQGSSQSQGQSQGQPAQPTRSAGPATYGGTGSESSNSGPGSSSGSSSGGSPPSGPDMTMIGGSSGESDSEYTLRDMPLGPLAVLFGYPFWIFGKTLSEEADEAVEERSLPDPEPKLKPRPSHPQDVAEQTRLERENAEMAEALRRSARPEPEPMYTANSNAIHDELAALERSLGRSPSPAPSRSASGSPVTSQPRRHADRDADGRSDVWSETAADGTRRETLDENGDGRVDRVNFYDAEHRLAKSEEDLDGDGRLETVSKYEGGELTRRTADQDGDGRPDSWTHYEAGEMVRHEVDQDRDGLRDLSMIYSSGELVREEQDRNADGRPDLISHYRNGEVIEKAEDTDYDGHPDLRSFYEHGRLVRREVS